MERCCIDSMKRYFHFRSSVTLIRLVPQLNQQPFSSHHAFSAPDAPAHFVQTNDFTEGSLCFMWTTFPVTVLKVRRGRSAWEHHLTPHHERHAPVLHLSMHSWQLSCFLTLTFLDFFRTKSEYWSYVFSCSKVLGFLFTLLAVIILPLVCTFHATVEPLAGLDFRVFFAFLLFS